MLRTAQARASLAPEERQAAIEAGADDVYRPEHQEEYRVPSTGARVTLQNARAIVHQYCQKLHPDG